MDLFKQVIADCIGNDIHVCLKNNAPTGAVLLTYCAMDAMAFLSMRAGKQKAERSDFKNWIQKYMKTDTEQPYQYDKEDLYGARCGIVHSYCAESDLSKKNKCVPFSLKRERGELMTDTFQFLLFLKAAGMCDINRPHNLQHKGISAWQHS